MSNDSTSTFSFSPRPEAQPMNWENLLSPVRHAVQALLLRIEGAKKEAKEVKAGETVANCFLIYGDRGTGKTTVLLSARKACNREERESFFKETGKDFFGKNHEREIREKAKQSAEELKDVVWLDVLDLEPLPPRANLLTTMLTRVRNALDSSGSIKPFDEVTSILEERADSARHKLDQLIKDATLMWEDISEQDTRSRANRQVAAADIYAQYQKQFREAIDTLSRELGRRSGSADTYRPIVLPIDNIDRSTEHLYSIVKLAKMVFSPRLWLVMAGDRQDVETFLERAYWQELIRIGETAGATGKTGISGEDEALTMARRQAAAALHKLLPPSHRIEVHLVKPQETLEFDLPSVSGQFAAKKTIRNLLADVQLFTKEEVPKKEENKDKDQKKFRIRLLDLFDPRDLIGKMQDKPNFPNIAELGLHLPARGVLDLWQLAYWITTDTTIQEHRKAEKIARIMLRNVIAESTLSSKMGRCLQEQIIRQNPEGGTMFDYSSASPQLKVTRLVWLDFDLESLVKVVSRQGGYAVRSRLNVWGFEAMILSFLSSQEEDSSEKVDELLPELVAAWLTVLHDTLIWGTEDTNIINPPDLLPPARVICSHESVLPNTKKKKMEVSWTVPDWGSFIAHNIFGRLWRHFLSENKPANVFDRPYEHPSLPRLLATGWVACVLRTSLTFAQLWEWEGTDRILNSLQAIISLDKDCKEGGGGRLRIPKEK